MIYMIRAGVHGPVKIGFSDDVVLRMVKMQADNHERLVLLRMFEGGALDEAALHMRFADNHLHGEWFGFTRAMLADVGLVEIVQAVEVKEILPEPPPVVEPGNPMGFVGWKLREARRAARLTQAAVARVLGISRSTLASIESGHDLPGRDLLLKLAPFFGTSVDELLAAPVAA